MIDFYADTPDEKEPKEKDFYPEESKDIDFYPDNIPDATPDITQEKPKEPSLFETLTKSLRISEEQRVGGTLKVPEGLGESFKKAEEQRVGGTLKVPEGLGESFRKAEEQRVGSGILEALDSEEFKTHITELFAHEGRRIEQEVDLGTKSGFSTTKHFLNNVTFNATKELLKDMPDESKAGALLGEFAGEAVYWLAISKLIGPFAAEVKATYGSLTTSSFYLNSILPAGAFKFTLSELIDKGEMPTGRELAEYENDLVLIHAAFELAGLGIQFNTAMRANAKLAGHSVADEYIDLAKSLKEAFVPNKFKNMSNKGQIEVLKDLITKRSTEIGFERPDIEIEGKRPITPGIPIEPKEITQKVRGLEPKNRNEIIKVAEKYDVATLDEFHDEVIPSASDVIDKEYPFHKELSKTLEEVNKRELDKGISFTEEELDKIKDYEKWQLKQVFDEKTDAVIINDPSLKETVTDFVLAGEDIIVVEKKDSFIVGKTKEAVNNLARKTPILDLKNVLKPTYYNELFQIVHPDKPKSFVEEPTESKPKEFEQKVRDLEPTKETPKDKVKKTKWNKLEKKIEGLERTNLEWADHIKKSQADVIYAKNKKAKDKQENTIKLMKNEIKKNETEITKLKKELVEEEKRVAKQKEAKENQKLRQEKSDLEKKKEKDSYNKRKKLTEKEKKERSIVKQKAAKEKAIVKQKAAKEKAIVKLKEKIKGLESEHKTNIEGAKSTDHTLAAHKSFKIKAAQNLKDLEKAKKRLKKLEESLKSSPPKKPPKEPPTATAGEPPEEKPKKKTEAALTTEQLEAMQKVPVLGKGSEKASVLSKALSKLPRALRPQSSLAKKLWDLRLDYFGDKRGAAMRHRAKWTKVLSERKLNSKDREDIIFYMEDPQAVGKSRDLEGTGNPFKDIDDTWNAIDKRISPASKEAVKDIRKHFQEVLKVLNESPYIKNISPREFLHEIYMPHFYEGNIDKALDVILADKRFSTSNSFADMRKFTLLNDALRKAGLIPKYRDIGTLLNHYDALVTRLILNSNLAQEIKLLEKEIGEKLVARPNDAKLYNRARNEKWEEFSDPYMRRRVIRQEEDGTLVFETSDANALVHPDLAPAIAGIFVKEAYKPDNIFLRGMDYYNDQVRGLRVQFYPMFHMGALSESLLGAQGLEGVFKLFKDFNVIFSDPEFNEFAAASGLEFGIPSDAKIGDAKVIFESALNKLEIRGGKAGITAGTIRKGLKKGMIGTEILFGQIHPRMKMLTFADYLAKVERQALKDGVDMTPEWRKQTGREIASIVNDQFGGQAWEMIRTFSNPKFLKWSRRGISYVDWSLSSIRQYFAMFEDIPRILRGEGPSIRGKFARQYNARYITYMTIISQFMSLLYTGMGNDKDKNGKPIANSVTWDYRKAHTTFQNKDSKHSGYLTQFFHYQLPDIQYNINGVKFNPGRDEKGRRLYSHGGKQFLELDNYRSNFVGQMFNKSTPFIQLAIPWAMDKKPGKGDWKPRGVWQGGKTIPWDGSEDWSLDRAISFIRFTRDQFIPFFADAAYKNPASFPVVFFGTFPVSKGISLTGSEEYFRTYYRILENDGYSEAAKKTARKRINELEDVLYDQNYSQTQINRRKNAAIKWNKERSSR
jgi:hypothetical protein